MPILSESPDPAKTLNRDTNYSAPGGNNAWVNVANATDGDTGTRAQSNCGTTSNSTFRVEHLIHATTSEVVFGFEVDLQYVLDSGAQKLRAYVQLQKGVTLQTEVLFPAAPTSRQLIRVRFLPMVVQPWSGTGPYYPVSITFQYEEGTEPTLYIYEIRFLYASRGEMTVIDG